MLSYLRLPITSYHDEKLWIEILFISCAIFEDMLRRNKSDDNIWQCQYQAVTQPPDFKYVYINLWNNISFFLFVMPDKSAELKGLM